MYKPVVIVVSIVLIGALGALGIHLFTPKASVTKPVQAFSFTGSTTPSDRNIELAKRFVEKFPDHPKGHNLLGSAYMQKARETGDFRFYQKAEAEIERSLQIAPEHLESRLLKATLLLSFHRFSEALVLGEQIRAQAPDLSTVYGILTDALIELGDYAQASETVEKMVHLRPDTASYARISYFRSLSGDTDGAIEVMRLAATSANPQDPEHIAWCYVHLGKEQLNAKDLDGATHSLDLALYAFPEYPLALVAKAKVSLLNGDMKEAATYLERAQNRSFDLDTAITLGDLYTQLREPNKARKQYQLVDSIEKSSKIAGEVDDRRLALYWADHEIRLDEALAVAENTRLHRADIYTFDLLAWSLFKKGDLPKAKVAIKQALRLGTRDAKIYYHAGMIYHAAGEIQEAVKYLKLALDTDAAFDLLQRDVALSTLKKMNEKPNQNSGKTNRS